MDSTEVASMGGKTRARNLTPAERSESARKAAKARWSRVRAQKRQQTAKEKKGGKAA